MQSGRGIQKTFLPEGERDQCGREEEKERSQQFQRVERSRSLL